MFDFHIHTKVSYDSQAEPEKVISVAESSGLKEICFTDHLDYNPSMPNNDFTFSTDLYNACYDQLYSDRIKICRGCEFGLLPDNADMLRSDLQRRPFDFVIGSAHCIDGMDIYYPDFWVGRSMAEAERKYFEEILACVYNHNDYDVLGHLTYICKLCHHIPVRHIFYEEYSSLIDEIFSVLIRKGKGIEVNTSGMDVCGSFLPDAQYLKRFKELGGRIVTVGSDSHNCERVGQYCYEACKMVSDIFGYVCTFQQREPIYHKF